MSSSLSPLAEDKGGDPVSSPLRSRSTSSSALQASSLLAVTPIDPSVFEALPPDIQQELLNEQAVRSAQQLASQQGTELQSTGARDGEPGGWTCRVCTFVNHPQLVECEICETLCLPDDDYERPPPAPGSLGGRPRATSAGGEPSAAATSRLSRSLRRLRFPATPATTTFTQKAEPTAEDLLVAASSKLQKGLQSARASWQNRRSRNNSFMDDNAADTPQQALPSLQAMRELTALQRELTHKCIGGDAWFEAGLERLWRAIYAENSVKLAANEPFERSRVDWVAVGFQNANPETDFRGGGVLALKCLLYAFEAHPMEMQAIRAAQTPHDEDGRVRRRWYPVCVAGINLTCLLAGMLQLGDGHFSSKKESFWPLFEEPAALFELFFLAFIKMDAVWHRLNATYMEFGVVLKVTRKMVAFVLAQAPHTLAELRAASDQAFLDRFVVSLSTRSLADWEAGECPDPYNVLDGQDVPVSSAKRTDASSEAVTTTMDAVWPLH